MKKETTNQTTNTINNSNKEKEIKTMTTTITLTKEEAMEMTRDQLRNEIELLAGPISNTYFRKSNKDVLTERLLKERKLLDESLAKAEEVESMKEETIITGKVCCGTGRRPKDLFGYDKNNYLPMVERMKAGVKWIIDAKGVDTFITGGAQGWDQLLFWAVNAVKREPNYTHVKNVLYIPFKGQETKWAANGLFSQAEYTLMFKYADDVKYITELTTAAPYKEIVDAMMLRNHSMVDASDYVFACYPDDSWKKINTKGGTAECLRYAYNKKRDTVIMNSSTLQSSIFNFSQLQ